MSYIREYIKAIISEECNKEIYWGIGGAGMIFICTQDSTVFLQKRSAHVTGGAGQWAFPGGGIHPKYQREDHYETPIDPKYSLEPSDAVFYDTAQQEVLEEVGSMPPSFRIIDSYIYEDCGFLYKTFIADVPLEAKEQWMPGSTEESAWESAGEGWFDAAEFSSKNLFFGFTSQLIQKVLGRIG